MAIKFTEEMGKKLKRLSIKSGSHDEEAKKFCIMEACNYIAGLPHSDDPVCVSDEIQEFLIGINDSRISDRERNKLKKVVPEIIGTCPTKKGTVTNYDEEGNYFDAKVEVPNYTKGYNKAENKRARILEEAFGDDGWGGPARSYNEISTKEAIEVAREMAAVKNKA